MITNVNWQYIILNGDSASGYRVKRRIGGSLPPVYSSGTDTPMADSWVSSPAPAQIPYNSKDYIFAFWSLNAQDALSSQRAAQIQTSNIANDSHSGGLWTISAKAYYVWNFGQGPGDNAILIDAFDIQAGDFIPDDFVDVTPPDGALTGDANNGYIDTTTQIAKGKAITIKSRDSLPAKQFGYWLNISSLLYSENKQTPATVGAPDSHDIVAHYNDVVVAFAFYIEVKQSIVIPPEWIYDPWWWIKTHGGLVPPGPPPPWLQEFAAALALADTANKVSPRLRARILEVALEQVSITSATIKKEIKSLQKK